MSNDQDILKFPKLTGAKDFIPWRRRMKAYIQRSDIDLLGLSDLQENASASQRNAWKKAMIKAKSSIVLTLDSGPMAQTSSIIDDEDKTAKDLWDSLSALYTTSNEQTVINLMQELENLEYKEDGNWEVHLNKFHEILGKLASLGKPIADQEKVSKLIRTLPDHFSPLAMVSSQMSYEQLVNAVETEISRCRMKKNEKNQGAVNIPKASSAKGHGLNVQGGRINKHGQNDNKICWICSGKNHLAKDCYWRPDRLDRNCMPWFRGRGRGRGRGFRGRGRGAGFFRGRGRGFQNPYGYQYPQMQQAPQQGFSQQGSWDTNTQSQQGGYFPQQNPSSQATRMQDNRPPSYPGNNSNNPPNGPYGFMARINFRSTIATCADEKTNDALVDSGGSHHFFHSRNDFIEYEEMEIADVQAASELSIIVGRGKVLIPLEGGFYMEAYHAPHFQSNILSVGLLTSHYNILFTMEPPSRNGLSSCIFSQRSSNKIIKVIEIGNDGLYRLMYPRRRQPRQSIGGPTSRKDHDQQDLTCLMCRKVFSSSKKTQLELMLEWHNKVGHPHAARYIELSNQVEDVPQFPRQDLESILCIPCAIGKVQRRPIQPSMRLTTFPLELVHLDISGKMSTPSVGGSIYAVGFVDDTTSKSDVHFIKKKSDLFSSLKYYKERSEHLLGRPMINIRLDGAGENMSNEVSDFCLQNGIRLEPSPPYAPQSNGVAERFMKELGMRSRVLLFSAKLDDTLWAEAMSHGNWLRNRLP